MALINTHELEAHMIYVHTCTSMLRALSTVCRANFSNEAVYIHESRVKGSTISIRMRIIVVEYCGTVSENSYGRMRRQVQENSRGDRGCAATGHRLNESR